MSVFNETIDELSQSINSILNQTYNNIELIIINDNPTSSSINNYLLNKKDKNNHIKLIINDKNRGAIFSRNIGMKNANGKYIAIMDADDIAKKNRLSFQIQFLNKYSLDLVCSNFSKFDDKSLIQKNSYIKKDLLNQDQIKYLLKYFNVVIGPTILFKKKILNKLEGYRNILVEDYDFAVRAMTYGYKVGYQSISLINKRERYNSLSGINSLKEFVIIDSIRKYIKKDKFSNILSTQFLEKSLDMISEHDNQCYKHFVMNSMKFKDQHSLTNLIKKYYYTLSSKIVFKRNLWMRFVNKRQNSFI